MVDKSSFTPAPRARAFNKTAIVGTGVLLSRHIRQINLPRCTRPRSLRSYILVTVKIRGRDTVDDNPRRGSNGSSVKIARTNLERSLTSDIKPVNSHARMRLFCKRTCVFFMEMVVCSSRIFTQKRV